MDAELVSLLVYAWKPAPSYHKTQQEIAEIQSRRYQPTNWNAGEATLAPVSSSSSSSPSSAAPASSSSSSSSSSAAPASGSVSSSSAPIWKLKYRPRRFGKGVIEMDVRVNQTDIPFFDLYTLDNQFFGLFIRMIPEFDDMDTRKASLTTPQSLTTPPSQPQTFVGNIVDKARYNVVPNTRYRELEHDSRNMMLKDADGHWDVDFAFLTNPELYLDGTPGATYRLKGRDKSNRSWTATFLAESGGRDMLYFNQTRTNIPGTRTSFQYDRSGGRTSRLRPKNRITRRR